MQGSVVKTGIIRHAGAGRCLRTVLHCAGAAAALMFAITGCASTPAAAVAGNQAASASAQQQAAAAPQVAVGYHVMAGEMAAQRGMTTIAAQQYVAALAYSDDAALARRA